MKEINDIILSDDLFERKFVCDLNSCKGACCVEGDSGAPLDEDECEILDDIYDDVKPYMRKEGIEVVKKMGTYVVDSDNDLVTPLINNQECAYVYFDEQNMAKCAIEKAYLDGKIDYKKPISCHLFPVRIKKYANFEAVNVQLIDICDPACALGEQLKVKVYEFLKEPLIRKYGVDFYAALEQSDQ